jgi:5-methylcytosine-specific restriction endonuclease McrA
MQTIVLNADYTYLNTVHWQRAIKLLVKEKAEVLKEDDKVICNTDSTCVFRIPLVMRLVDLVKTVYRNKVPFSRKHIFIRDNFTCQYCGTHTELNIDHIVPRSRGGKTSFANCITSCVTCNNAKGNRTPNEANMRLRKEPHEPTIMEFLVYKMKHTGVYKFLKEIGVY